jgi:hypothetical protein
VVAENSAEKCMIIRHGSHKGRSEKVFTRLDFQIDIRRSIPDACTNVGVFEIECSLSQHDQTPGFVALQRLRQANRGFSKWRLYNSHPMHIPIIFQGLV